MATFLASSLLQAPNGTAWRPPQYQKAAMFMIAINGQQNSPAAQVQNGVLRVGGVTTQIYVFDAVLSADHRQDATITSFPVQTGASISDHAYIQPAEITLDIGMSDAMDAYASSASSDPAIAAGVWSGRSKSRSVNAYQTMVDWEAKRVLMSLTTRLFTYPTAMVASLSPHENSGTITGLRCRVTFKQIFLANTTTLNNASARAQDTGNTGLGQVAAGTPTNAQTSQYGGQSGANVPGAGSWASNPIFIGVL